MFFLRVLCVPPSRFRPPTRFGDMLVDHPQNVYFKHILDMDAKLQKMQRGEAIPKFEKRVQPKSKKAKQEEAEAAAAAGGAAAEERAPLDLNLLITTWIALQTEVNMLLDSTKGGQVSANAVVTAGIRQTFEKKEGLFRRSQTHAATARMPGTCTSSDVKDVWRHIKLIAHAHLLLLCPVVQT